MEKLVLTISGNGTSTKIDAPSGIPQGLSLGGIITASLGVLITAGILIALVFLAYGALLWITSAEEKTKVEKARKTLIYSVVGLFVIFLSFLIVNLIAAVLQVSSPIAR